MPICLRRHDNDVIFPKKIVKNCHISTCCSLLSQFLTIFYNYSFKQGKVAVFVKKSNLLQKGRYYG